MAATPYKITDLTASTSDINDSSLVEVSYWTGAGFVSRKYTWATLRKSLVESYYVPVSDIANDIAIGSGLNYIQFPYAVTVVGVGATMIDAPTGSVATFDINDTTTSILSTKITIDATETTSETASVQPVISDSAIAANAPIIFDIDGVGSSNPGKGAIIRIDVTRD